MQPRVRPGAVIEAVCRDDVERAVGTGNDDGPGRGSDCLGGDRDELVEAGCQVSSVCHEPCPGHEDPGRSVLGQDRLPLLRRHGSRADSPSAVPGGNSSTTTDPVTLTTALPSRLSRQSMTLAGVVCP